MVQKPLVDAATVKLRDAMMSARPPVEMKAIDLPSGEYLGPVFMPTRSTMVRGVPPLESTA